jgi:hypothetical protein
MASAANSRGLIPHPAWTQAVTAGKGSTLVLTCVPHILRLIEAHKKALNMLVPASSDTVPEFGKHHSHAQPLVDFSAISTGEYVPEFLFRPLMPEEVAVRVAFARTHAAAGRAEFAVIPAQIANWQSNPNMRYWGKCHARVQIKWDKNSCETDNARRKRFTVEAVKKDNQ